MATNQKVGGSSPSWRATSRRTLVVRRIFLRKMRLHRTGCRSSPRKVTLGSAARLQAPSLTPRCRYQLFAVEGHCSLGIYFVTLTHDGVTKLMSLHFCLISSGFQPFFENDSHTTLTVDVQGILRLKAGFPPGFSRQEAPFFCFLPVFSAGGCVKVSGGFLYKSPSNLGRSQRSPFQGGNHRHGGETQHRRGPRLFCQGGDRSAHPHRRGSAGNSEQAAGGDD